MLTINVSGWNKNYGPYNKNIPFDDQKTDYEIHFKDGSLYKQTSSFTWETHDWNNDGDVHSQQGAWFRDQDGRGEFFAPVDMIRLVMDERADIPGLLDPLAAIKGYAKAQEEAQEAKKLAESQAYPVSCTVDGKAVAIPFDTTKMDYMIELDSGQTFFQTGRFHEEYFLPDRTRVNPPVMATWFKDSNGTARFFTAKEMLELAASGRAKIEGIEIPSPLNKEHSRSKHENRRRSVKER